MQKQSEIYDVVIVGAGISGIGTAYWLQKKCPGRKFTILESRNTIGGTWSLFKYPGIRSDSDMFTFGYRFKPWKNPQLLSSGENILQYLNETVAENNILPKIQFGCQLLEAHWFDEKKYWQLLVKQGDEHFEIRAKFICNCSGYYSYEESHKPFFVGEQNFKGEIILPQFWKSDFDYKNKKIVVVGSGATAITLVPSMAAMGAAHVTMLQRSPSYILTIPNRNKLFAFLRNALPPMISYKIIRYIVLTFGTVFYALSRKFPKQVKAHLVKTVAKQLPKGYDVEKHFTPKYNPWDQRVCAVPDGDLFKQIRNGKVSVVTDSISHFTENGIMLKSEGELKADAIVLATGLKLCMMGNVKYFVNGKQIHFNKHIVYKGMMFSDVPNLVNAFGYTNASWTLKVDLTAEYFCKLLNHMSKKKMDVFVPAAKETATDETIVNLTSGYIQRAAHILPKQGKALPWRVYQNYFVDKFMMQYGKIDDGHLKFM